MDTQDFSTLFWIGFATIVAILFGVWTVIWFARLVEEIVYASD